MSNTTTIQLEGLSFEIKTDNPEGRYDFDGRARKGRVYVGGEPTPEFLGLVDRQPPFSRKCEDPKAHGWNHGPDRGCDPELDKEWRRYNRLELKIQRQIIDAAVEAGLLPELTKKSFSRTAGCSCGCSSGWVVEGRGTWMRDFWVTVKNDFTINTEEVSA